MPNPDQTLRYQLKFAIKSGFTQRALKLMKAGADVRDLPGEPSLVEAAMLGGQPEVAELLVEKGAAQPEFPKETALAIACACNDEARAMALVEEDPELMEKLQVAHPEHFQIVAERGKCEAVRLMVKLGSDVNRGTAMHGAVWHGQLAVVKLLVELGADLEKKDPTHGSTPLQWATFHGERQEIAEFLQSC